MTIPIHLTEISTFEWSENEKSVTKPPFFEASSRHMAIWLIGQISGSSCMTYPIVYAILSKFLLRLRLSFRLPLRMRPMRNKYL